MWCNEFECQIIFSFYRWHTEVKAVNPTAVEIEALYNSPKNIYSVYDQCGQVSLHCDQARELPAVPDCYKETHYDDCTYKIEVKPQVKTTMFLDNQETDVYMDMSGRKAEESDENETEKHTYECIEKYQ